MKISVLVENVTQKEYDVEHGLSLFIELENGRRILFDTGQSELFMRNAKLLGCDIAAVDFAVLSHGHYDHGGGLRAFFQNNVSAKVYAQKSIFESRYSLKEAGLKYIGLDRNLSNEFADRFKLCGNQENISEDIILFSCKNKSYPIPQGNALLYGSDKKSNDEFSHEHNMIVVEGDKVVLFAGCAHCGILNIMSEAERLTGKAITHVVGGFHLMQGLTINEEIKKLSCALLAHESCKYYTMHCTGVAQYEALKQSLGNRIEYLSCGEVLSI